MDVPIVRVARVYDDPGRGGKDYRVLADRLWPRGRSRASMDLDEWAKDATPTPELRRWYGHEPDRFAEFTRRYRLELAASPAAPVVHRLRELSRSRPLVLLTAVREVDRSSAAILKAVIEGG